MFSLSYINRLLFIVMLLLVFAKVDKKPMKWVDFFTMREDLSTLSSLFMIYSNVVRLSVGVLPITFLYTRAKYFGSL